MSSSLIVVIKLRNCIAWVFSLDSLHLRCNGEVMFFETIVSCRLRTSLLSHQTYLILLWQIYKYFYTQIGFVTKFQCNCLTILLMETNTLEPGYFVYRTTTVNSWSQCVKILLPLSVNLWLFFLVTLFRSIVCCLTLSLKIRSKKNKH